MHIQLLPAVDTNANTTYGHRKYYKKYKNHQIMLHISNIKNRFRTI